MYGSLGPRAHTYTHTRAHAHTHTHTHTRTHTHAHAHTCRRALLMGQGREELVRSLLGARARGGLSPLMLAAGGGRMSVVEYLLGAGGCSGVFM